MVLILSEITKETVRINFNIPKHLLKKVDDYALIMGLNRSSAINMLCGTALQSVEGIQTIKDLLYVYEQEKNDKSVLEIKDK